MNLTQLLDTFGYNPNYRNLNPGDQFKHEALERAKAMMIEYAMDQGELVRATLEWFRFAFISCLQRAVSDVVDEEVLQQIEQEKDQVLGQLDQWIGAAEQKLVEKWRKMRE